MLASLALVSFLAAAPTDDAQAVSAPVLPIKQSAFTIRGKGMRGSSTLGGSLQRAADGSVSGEMVIILTSATDTATACRYRKFDKVNKSGGTVTFDAVGKCFTVAPSGAVTEWKASNAFAIVQGGGKIPDTIDVNMYGTNGITIPGGYLDSGDFELL
jgi:hypothetical protein